jgi:tetratricopeptide (TPR) repeat protein
VGLLLEQQGQFDEALQHLVEATRIHPEYKAALEDAARVAEQLGRTATRRATEFAPPPPTPARIANTCTGRAISTSTAAKMPRGRRFSTCWRRIPRMPKRWRCAIKSVRRLATPSRRPSSPQRPRRPQPRRPERSAPPGGI